VKLLKKFNLPVILALLACIFGLNISKTYTWFSSDKSAALVAKVAASDDIIKSVKVDNLDAPTKVIITKAKECTSSPIIYFELTGRLPYYVQHMNPLELNASNKKAVDSEGNYIYEIPINVKVNRDENNHLSDVQGSIIVRYLNGFISLPINGIRYSVSNLSGYYGKTIPEIKYNASIKRDNISEIKDIILESFDPAKDNPANIETPYKIKITTNKNDGTNSVLYFELTGQLPYYIQQINPVLLSRDKDIYEIPIYAKVSSNDYSTVNGISGDINIRCLNSTYEKSINISYSSDNIRAAQNFWSRDPNIKRK